MDITYYLVELLRFHDCVIVPDLGGFVTNYRPAEIDLAGSNFNPPVKEIIFTGKLIRNDGLLVNYISEREGVGYMEARQIISEFVDQAWSKLENGDKLEFQHIGFLHFDRNEKLIFEPEVHENLLLDAFGMEGFQFPQLEWNEIIPSKSLFTDKDSVRPLLRKGKVKVLAIGIPMLLALVLVPVSKYSWNKPANQSLQTSSAVSIPINNPITPATPAKSETTHAVQPAGGKSAESLTQPIVNVKRSEPAVALSNARFRVIGGCFKIRENADKFAGKLRADGFKPESKTLPNGTFLIIVQSYTNKNEALAALQTLRQADPKAGYFMSGN